MHNPVSQMHFSAKKHAGEQSESGKERTFTMDTQHGPRKSTRTRNRSAVELHARKKVHVHATHYSGNLCSSSAFYRLEGDAKVAIQAMMGGCGLFLLILTTVTSN